MIVSVPLVLLIVQLANVSCVTWGKHMIHEAFAGGLSEKQRQTSLSSLFGKEHQHM